MALPGMKSTADFNDDENPMNWRLGILKLSPRNGAPLYALTSMMKSEKVDAPEFKWFEEPLFMYTFVTHGSSISDSATTIAVTSGALRLKPGDTLRAPSREVVRVISIVSDTEFTVERARGEVGSPAGTAAAIPASSILIYIGSAYREGAPRSLGVSTAPVKNFNYTQIFRDPVEITRTAQQTSTYRTGDPFKNDRERTAHKHSLGIERAFWFGSRYETMETSQPIRYTGGVTEFIDAANVRNGADGSGAAFTDIDELLQLFPAIFAFGSKEKLAFGSLAVQSNLGRLVRHGGEYSWGPSEKEYGIDVRRFFTPAGTLVITEHPMFSSTPGLDNDLLVIDTANLRYRHLQDTTYLKNRQDNGVDGKCDEFLTEAGLEVWHGKTHYWLRNLSVDLSPPAGGGGGT